MPRRPRWERFLSEISEWDQRFERDRAPWIELAAGLVALSVVVVSLLATVDEKNWPTARGRASVDGQSPI